MQQKNLAGSERRWQWECLPLFACCCLGCPSNRDHEAQRDSSLTYPDAGHGSLFQYPESFTKHAAVFLDSDAESGVF